MSAEGIFKESIRRVWHFACTNWKSVCFFYLVFVLPQLGWSYVQRYNPNIIQFVRIVIMTVLGLWYSLGLLALVLVYYEIQSANHNPLPRLSIRNALQFLFPLIITGLWFVLLLVLLLTIVLIIRAMGVRLPNSQIPFYVASSLLIWLCWYLFFFLIPILVNEKKRGIRNLIQSIRIVSKNSRRLRWLFLFLLAFSCISASTLALGNVSSVLAIIASSVLNLAVGLAVPLLVLLSTVVYSKLTE